MRRYLVVDDNVELADNVAEILGDAGALVDVQTGGAGALEKARRERYDLLISDMRMPVMGGAALVHAVRRIDPGVPAVVMTAYTNDEDLDAARHEGLLAVLAKPVPVPRLLQLAASARRDGLIVVVEDDRAFADNLLECLRERGFAGVTAGSVLEAGRLGDVRPFAALVDLRVPGGPDGAAMSRLARTFPGLPMVVVTGHDEVQPPEPHVGLFRKPFKTSELLELLERLYDTRHA